MKLSQSPEGDRLQELPEKRLISIARKCSPLLVVRGLLFMVLAILLGEWVFAAEYVVVLESPQEMFEPESVAVAFKATQGLRLQPMRCQGTAKANIAAPVSVARLTEFGGWTPVAAELVVSEDKSYSMIITETRRLEDIPMVLTYTVQVSPSVADAFMALAEFAIASVSKSSFPSQDSLQLGDDRYSLIVEVCVDGEYRGRYISMVVLHQLPPEILDFRKLVPMPAVDVVLSDE